MLAFTEGRRKPEWPAPSCLAANRAWACAQNIQTHWLTHIWPAVDSAPSLGLLHREMGWQKQL